MIVVDIEFTMLILSPLRMFVFNCYQALLICIGTFLDSIAVKLAHRHIKSKKISNDQELIQSANGSSLNVDGCVNVQFRIGGTEVSQDFYVVRDLNRNMILGLDWLKSNNVRIYFDLKSLRINGKTYINLEEDIHVASTVKEVVPLTRIRHSLGRRTPCWHGQRLERQSQNKSVPGVFVRCVT